MRNQRLQFDHGLAERDQPPGIDQPLAADLLDHQLAVAIDDEVLYPGLDGRIEYRHQRTVFGLVVGAFANRLGNLHDLAGRSFKDRPDAAYSWVGVFRRPVEPGVPGTDVHSLISPLIQP